MGEADEVERRGHPRPLAALRAARAGVSAYRDLGLMERELISDSTLAEHVSTRFAVGRSSKGMTKVNLAMVGCMLLLSWALEQR